MGSEGTLTLAALQIAPTIDIVDTLSQISRLLSELSAKNQRIDCVVLPEYAFGTFREWLDAKYNTETIFEQIQEVIVTLCHQYNIPIIAGSVPYQTKKGAWRNRSYLFSSKGKILGTYDKQHPFRAEKLLGLEPGTHSPTFKIRQHRLAILICSDLWFHDTVSAIATEVDFIAVPTMTTVLDSEHIKYGQWAWQSLVAVRAKEFTVPIVSADQASREYAPGIFTCGGSCIADPSYRFTNTEGPFTQALRMATNEKTSFIMSSFDLNKIRKYSEYRQKVGLKK